MLSRTEAITLRSVEYGETSEIVTLFTRLHGRITVMAKGARGPRARFGSTLQPMSYLQAVYYYRPNRSVHTLSESSHIKPWRNLTRDMGKLGSGLRIVELMNALFLEDEPHESLFDQLVEVFQTLDAAHDRVENIWPYFQLLLAAELGFSPAFTREDVEAVEQSAYLHLPDGTISDRRGGESLQVARGVIRAFAILARSDLETAMRLRLARGEARRVDRLVESYLRYHIERAYPTRVSAVIQQLERRPLRDGHH